MFKSFLKWIHYKFERYCVNHVRMLYRMRKVDRDYEPSLLKNKLFTMASSVESYLRKRIYP